MLTIERIKEISMKFYNKGGNSIIECYTDRDIQNLIDTGINTEEKLIEFIRQMYVAWGMCKTKNKETETSEEKDYDDVPYDQCCGCQRYNCKHCQYGDDGNYSVYDVYSPSELGVTVKW